MSQELISAKQFYKVRQHKVTVDMLLNILIKQFNGCASKGDFYPIHINIMNNDYFSNAPVEYQNKASELFINKLESKGWYVTEAFNCKFHYSIVPSDVIVKECEDELSAMKRESIIKVDSEHYGGLVSNNKTRYVINRLNAVYPNINWRTDTSDYLIYIDEPDHAPIERPVGQVFIVGEDKEPTK